MSSSGDRVRKACDRCGTVAMVLRRARACMRLERNSKGFKTGYRCPGALRRVEPPKRRRQRERLPPLPDGVGLGYVLSEEYAEKMKQSRGALGRARAAKELAKAEAKQKEWQAEARRIDTLCRKWAKAVRRYKARATWTDEQFADERRRAATAAKVSHVKRRLTKAAGASDAEAQS